MRLLPIAVIAIALAAAPLGCSGGGGAGRGATGPAAAPAGGPPAAIPGTSVRMDYTPGGDFYKAPFPDESRRLATGAIDLDRFPNRTTNLFVQAVAAIAAAGGGGFGCTSGIFFALDGPVGPLPALDATVARGAPVFLISVDPAAPDFLRRYPVTVDFQLDGGAYGAPNLLSLLPLQGVPLREETLYAAVVLRSLGDAGGAPLGVPVEMALLAAGVPPPGMAVPAFLAHEAALAALRQDGTDPRSIAGIAVFRTGRPTEELERFRRFVLARPLPQPTAPLSLVATYPDYCVLKSTIRMPIFQGGAPPFLLGGGGWMTDASGTPLPQGTEEANLFVTIPRRSMPAAGFPAVVFIRTGAGQSECPLVDRVPYPAGAPGTGPALELARAGFAGVEVDGPHGGLRNVTRQDEQLLMFNFANPLAMRDNIRQSALELIALADVLPGLAIDPAQCPGASVPGGGPVRLDGGRVALFGHSMGATIAPLVLAGAPRYRAAILSGAGASWIENVLWKEKPLPILPTAELILGYAPQGRALHRHDPALSLLQWGGEPADPQVYARYVTREPRLGAPRHVLMFQGIVDHYILPPIANAMSLALGLDQGGAALDATLPAFPWFAPLGPLAPLGGVGAVALPCAGNRTGPAGAPYTAVLVQHPEDGIQDGHEVVFQRPEPKQEYRTFLETFAAGAVPLVP
jgi:hypothetical protein